ncbi:MAG: DUF3604 domain-containing protein, partial [Pseudomonadota bacterium]
MRKLTKLGLGVGVAGIAWIAYTAAGVHLGWFGDLETAGKIQGAEVPNAVIEKRVADQSKAGETIGVSAPKQIVFGDLHVHTTYSTDAFMWSLPMLGGEGAYPLADACDYARYCSAIDFWAISDHAEASTPRKWQVTQDAIKQCNAVSGDPSNPDLVSYLGFEWTQVGRLPEEHYGHKNVIFEGTGEDDVSARAIASAGAAFNTLRQSDLLPARTAYADWSNRQRYFDFRAFMDEVQSVPLCEPGVASNELPVNCMEVAVTPADLTRKLEEQGLDYLLIPHGTSWGFYTPPGTSLDKQLTSEMRPETMELFEIYSGHGNSEEYRRYRSVLARETSGGLVGICPDPSETYTPPCWRAGEIIEARCLEGGEPPEVCETRAEETRSHAANMGVAYHLTVKGENSEDWLDSGQCNDCFLPAFHHRPMTSAQYGLAISNFDEDPEDPNRFHWGFIGSSDNHRARPGTGYKEFDRFRTTEMGGVVSSQWRDRFLPPEDPLAVSRPIPAADLARSAGFGLTETERQASFWLTGGLAAVHTQGRSRSQIWDAMKRRETYATSGPRILLWFDMLADGETVPMGSATSTADSPSFTVRAVGAFKQLPGCPEFTMTGLSANRVTNLCANECYNPSDERHLISRIEVVRVRPQAYKDEPVDDLIEDPWRVFDCPDDPAGCAITFTDEDFARSARDTTYYVRAIQEQTLAINADPLNCTRDDEGRCIEVDMCRGDWRADFDDPDECLDPVEERAWSSPIYVNWRAGD